MVVILLSPDEVAFLIPCAWAGEPGINIVHTQIPGKDPFRKSLYVAQYALFSALNCAVGDPHRGPQIRSRMERELVPAAAAIVP